MTRHFLASLFLIFIFTTTQTHAQNLERITYKNDFYGFQIQYPTGWTLKEINEDGREKIFSFETTTKDPSWITSRKSHSAPIFQIEIYTQTSYKQNQASCQQDKYTSSFCLRLANIYGQSTQYIFVIYDRHSAAFEAPTDIPEQSFDEGEKSLRSLRIFEP